MRWVVLIPQTINLPLNDLIQEWECGCQCHQCPQGNLFLKISILKGKCFNSKLFGNLSHMCFDQISDKFFKY